MYLQSKGRKVLEMIKFEMYVWTYEDGGYFEYYRDIVAESYTQAYEKAKIIAKEHRFYDFEVIDIEDC